MSLHNADDAAITTAIISMAHSLKLYVIAEGVESAEQLEFLRKQGCDVMQDITCRARCRLRVDQLASRIAARLASLSQKLTRNFNDAGKRAKRNCEAGSLTVAELNPNQSAFCGTNPSGRDRPCFSSISVNSLPRKMFVVFAAIGAAVLFPLFMVWLAAIALLIKFKKNRGSHERHE